MTHTPESTPTLEPCPFCESSVSWDDELLDVVRCPTCFADGPWSIGQSKAEAIAAWNKRPTPPASQSDALTDLTRETEVLGLYGGQSEALVVEMARALATVLAGRQDGSDNPADWLNEARREEARAILPIINAREAAAEAKGKREGVEEAARLVDHHDRTLAQAIRALAEKQP